MDDENEQKKNWYESEQYEHYKWYGREWLPMTKLQDKKSNKLHPKFNKTVYHIFGTSMEV